MLGGLLVAGLLAVLVGQELSPRLSLANVAPLFAGCVQLLCLLRGVLRVASYGSRQRGCFRQLYIGTERRGLLRRSPFN